MRLVLKSALPNGGLSLFVNCDRGFKSPSRLAFQRCVDPITQLYTISILITFQILWDQSTAFAANWTKKASLDEERAEVKKAALDSPGEL